MEVQNRPGFADANTVIYGHHMKNGSMFAALAEYAAPSVPPAASSAPVASAVNCSAVSSYDLSLI
mgnify:CR=1 FL=1